MSTYCDCCISDTVYVQEHLLGSSSILEYPPDMDEYAIADDLIYMWERSGEPVSMSSADLATIIYRLRAREQSDTE